MLFFDSFENLGHTPAFFLAERLGFHNPNQASHSHAVCLIMSLVLFGPLHRFTIQRMVYLATDYHYYSLVHLVAHDSTYSSLPKVSFCNLLIQLILP